MPLRLLQVIRKHRRRDVPEIVAAAHHASIGSRTADCHDVAPAAERQLPARSPHIARLADRTHDIILLQPVLPSFGQCRKILDLVIGAVQGRPYKIIHSGIHDEEGLCLPVLHEQDPGDEGSALSHQRTSRLHADPLVRPSAQLCRDSAQPGFEIRYRELVRFVIIHAKSAAKVNAPDLQALRLKITDNLRSALTLK